MELTQRLRALERGAGLTHRPRSVFEMSDAELWAVARTDPALNAAYRALERAKADPGTHADELATLEARLDERLQALVHGSSPAT